MRTLSGTTHGITDACDLLLQGGIVIHSTETCYGLACDLTNKRAVAKLFALKQRKTDQPVSALFASLDDVKKYVEWPEKAEELVQEYLPGPLTLVLPIQENAPNILHITPSLQPTTPACRQARYNLQPTLGIRLSSHPIAQQLVQAFGKPLSTTSANISGKEPCYSVEEIAKQFPDTDDSVVLLDGGELEKRAPSQVISFINGKVEYLRT